MVPLPPKGPVPEPWLLARGEAKILEGVEVALAAAALAAAALAAAREAVKNPGVGALVEVPKSLLEETDALNMLAGGVEVLAEKLLNRLGVLVVDGVEEDAPPNIVGVEEAVVVVVVVEPPNSKPGVEEAAGLPPNILAVVLPPNMLGVEVVGGVPLPKKPGLEKMEGLAVKNEEAVVVVVNVALPPNILGEPKVAEVVVGVLPNIGFSGEPPNAGVEAVIFTTSSSPALSFSQPRQPGHGEASSYMKKLLGRRSFLARSICSGVAFFS